FIASIVSGIAALVAIYSFGNNLNTDIDKQAATLIGADMAVFSNKPASDGGQKLFDNLKKKSVSVSEERSFASMIYFPKSQGTRLVQVRALGGSFPWYGELETQPVSAAKIFRRGREALVDKTLMLQYKAKVGDSVSIGKVNFRIAGILNKAPGQTGFASTIAPAVFIPIQYLEQTGLMQKGSRINYNTYYLFRKDVDAEKLAKQLEKRFDKEELNYDTIASRKENTGKSFGDLTRFLALVGFIALLLGCIGVASSVHIYVREKLGSIAVLRCLGATSRQAFLIYLVQIVGIGLLGSVAGAIIGTFIQQILPVIFKDFLPIAISSDLSWTAILQGVALGVLISVLFALLPLISIRRISPLNTLRAAFDDTARTPDRLSWFVYGLLVLFILGFTRMLMDGWKETFVFTAGLFAGFLVLYGIAALAVWLTRRFVPARWSYLLRQGLSNLNRPNNQTVILVLAIGLGTAFISTLVLVQNTLISRVTLASAKNQPNMVLFDIQASQREELLSLTKKERLPVIQDVPVVTMSLESVNGHTAADAKKDSTLGFKEGMFRREFRVTYRDTLTSTEKITSGKFGTENSKSDTPMVSLEEGYAGRNNLKLGDRLDFNVQGVPMTVKIGSLRSVDWNRVQTNFLVLFPNGVLEQAPQFHVLVTRVPDNTVSARFQQLVVSRFPNVSVIDLGLILSVVDDILDKIGFVIRFMDGFSILTGVVVLIASVMISKYQRIRESVLLRTMGASRRQIFVITSIEYFSLGAISAFTGIVLSVAATWALAYFQFDAPFRPDVAFLAALLLAISLLTLLIGLVNSRGIVNRSPLEVLRRES
ncbi:MAG: ABC transporter permease, partial [Mucilaginibacter polytrichastri]|nr:ABC transporter permease [Mucilaginibacter polytrichastri]